MIVCGPETPGHLVGNAIRTLYKNGTDNNKKIIGTDAPAPFLFNIPRQSIQRFIEQTKFIDLVNEGSPEVIRDAVWSCYQEKPTKFKEYELWDMGAYEADPICNTITWKITNPAYGPKDEKEKEALEKMQDLIRKLKERDKK